MILIKVENYIDNFINKCIKNNINIFNIEKYDNYILVKIYKKDFKKVKKLNYYSKIKIIKYYGKEQIIKNIKKYKFDLFLLLMLIILLYFISNIIVSVDIKHENKELKQKVNNILDEYNIRIFTYGKSLKELNEISDKILSDNRDFLDWISINKEGMHYIVSFEERKHIDFNDNKTFCDIVASKNGVVKKIITTKGMEKVEVGSSFNKGDVLISGQIFLNEEVKGAVCAEGIIIAETWYKVNVSMPLSTEEKIYTGNKRTNFSLNGKKLYRKNYNNYDEKILFEFKNFKIIEDKEFMIKQKKLDVKEAKKTAINKAKNNLLNKIGKNNEINDQKVLKDSSNNSKIELELFISVNESVGVIKNVRTSDVDDTKQSIRYIN